MSFKLPQPDVLVLEQRDADPTDHATDRLARRAPAPAQLSADGDFSEDRAVGAATDREVVLKLREELGIQRHCPVTRSRPGARDPL